MASKVSKKRSSSASLSTLRIASTSLSSVAWADRSSSLPPSVSLTARRRASCLSSDRTTSPAPSRLSSPRLTGLPIGRWIHELAARHDTFRAELVDLAEIGLPLLDEPKHPRLGQYTQPHTKAWSAKVDAADAFVFVMPEFNHGFNAPLKNAIDFLHREWSRKPVGFVSYGGVAAGTRAVQMLKPVLTVLRMVPVTAAVPIPFVRQIVREDGTVEATGRWRRRQRGCWTSC
jgi:NAD(P)H-dependent FMN reductase